MNYIMRSGCLSKEQSCEVMAKIKSTITGPVKKILLSDAEYHTDIRRLNPPPERSGDVRFREYIFADQKDTWMTGRPYYADGEDPAIAGWPVCRLPRVDHALIRIGEQEYDLTMHNSQNYSMKDRSGYVILQIMHRGLMGGWQFHDDHGFAPEVLCGIFAFCRYIEQENEFLIV